MQRYIFILILIALISACTPPVAIPPTHTPQASTELKVSPTPQPSLTSEPVPTQTPTSSATVPPLPSATPIPIIVQSSSPSCPDKKDGSAPMPAFIDPTILEEENDTEEHLRQKYLEAIQDEVVLNYLNQYGFTSVLENYQKVSKSSPGSDFIFYRDVTNDGLPELLMFLGRENISLRIYNCVGEKYKVLFSKDVGGSPSPRANPKGDPPPILTVKDLNNDGLIEISTLSGRRLQESGKYQDIGIGHKYQIFQWDGDDFRSLLFDPSRPGFESAIYVFESGEIYYKELTGDATNELIAYKGTPIWSEYSNGFPWRSEWNFFRWDGINYLLYRKIFNPPVYRFQAIQDADRFFSYGEIEKAIDLYTQVINDPDLKWYSYELQQFLSYLSSYPPDSSTLTKPAIDTEEYFNLSAYARFRLLLISLLKGKERQAENIYKQIQKQYPQGQPGSIFAEMATIFWDEYSTSKDLSTACNKYIAFTMNHQDEILWDLGSAVHALQIHVYEPNDVCNIDVIP